MSHLASLTLAIRVTPRSSANVIVGWRSDQRNELDIRVSAAPEDGKANAAVIKTLARSLGIPKSAIEILRGHSSRQKLVAFEMDAQGYEQWRSALSVRP
jgi:uncharacterized protein (TIGR00251 family)